MILYIYWITFLHLRIILSARRRSWSARNFRTRHWICKGSCTGTKYILHIPNKRYPGSFLHHFTNVVTNSHTGQINWLFRVQTRQKLLLFKIHLLFKQEETKKGKLRQPITLNLFLCRLIWTTMPGKFSIRICNCFIIENSIIFVVVRYCQLSFTLTKD